MIDSVFVALSGMQGHERGLKTISHNVSNMNTPGFRGSSVNFADVLSQDPLPAGFGRQFGGQQSSHGSGVDASRVRLDMKEGDPQQTGRDLDVRLDGPGFFVLRSEGGALRYSRAGRFTLDDGRLFFDADKRVAVMTRSAEGDLVPVSVKNLRSDTPAKQTSKVALGGILSSSDSDGAAEVEPLTVFDAKGVAHTLKLKFIRESSAGEPFPRWNMTVLEGAEEVGKGVLEHLDAGTPLAVRLALSGTDPVAVDFDLSSVSMGPLGDTSNPLITSADGNAPLTITGQRFDEAGTLILTYSDGQTLNGPRLALAQIADLDGLVEIGDAMFEYRGEGQVVLREAGTGLRVVGQALELSNVELTKEFSQLILMQRGYQAASQVLSTANDMMQELLNMRGRR